MKKHVLLELAELNDREPAYALVHNVDLVVVRYDEEVSVLYGRCAHRGALMSDGYIDGCITCPWHGFQYRPEDGCSPPPFTEKIATYELQLDGDTVLLNPKALSDGTERPVTIIDELIDTATAQTHSERQNNA